MTYQIVKKFKTTEKVAYCDHCLMLSAAQCDHILNVTCTKLLNKTHQLLISFS